MTKIIILGAGISTEQAIAFLEEADILLEDIELLAVKEAMAQGKQDSSFFNSAAELDKAISELALSIKELPEDEETTIRADQREQARYYPKVKKFKNHHQNQQRFKRAHKTRNR